MHRLMILFFLFLFFFPELKGQTKNLLDLEYNVINSISLYNNFNKPSPPELSDEQKEIIKTYTIIGLIAGFLAGVTLGIIRVNTASENSDPLVMGAVSPLIVSFYGVIGLITGGAGGWLMGNLVAYNSK